MTAAYDEYVREVFRPHSIGLKVSKHGFQGLKNSCWMLRISPPPPSPFSYFPL